jgi:GH25 family lysozyme M1 (1,4-beta-N-acetylmuramidase)
MPRLCAILAATAIVCSASASTRAQTFVQGIDVSLFQDTVDWPTVRAEGVEFAFVRATRGDVYDDPLFLANMRQATKAGVLVGPYHFCNLDTDTANPLDPVIEANHFLRVIKPYYDAGMVLPPVADVEGFPTFGSTAEARAFTSNWVQQFSDTIYASLGVRPLIYTSLSKANSYYTSSIASQHDLWLAWWKTSGTANPPIASDTPLWGIWQFWQWTDNWTVNGIVGAVDGDLFNGNRTQLEGFLHGDGPLGGLPGGRLMLSDFNSSEGYLGFSPTYSGSNVNILSTTTAELTSTEAYEGTGSQQLAIDSGGGAWTLRFVSGIGAPPFTPANPTTNLPLDATGSIGLWIKTANSGMTVQMLIDDPTAANPSAIEGGVARNIVADGQWHLYEWAFADAAQWNNYAGGGNGAITDSIVTIDSLRFTGSGDATLYLDALSQNPAGSLLPPPGDFDRDLDVDGDDLAIWRAALGVSAAGDATGDGQTDGADLLVWQRHATGAAAAVTAGASAANVPEPASVALAAAGLIPALALRCYAQRHGR